jgi:hypothetical protein
VAEYEGCAYVDLANDRWEAVEITASGWRAVADPPVKFRRAKGMGALPHPVQGENISSLRAFINIATDDDWILLCAWLVQAIRPRGPYPIGVLQGEQGSAKSTAARVLRSLIDPNVASLRSEPRSEHDLMIAATNGWCVALDNLSNIPVWLSDALCRLATGGGFATRELYSDSDEVLFDAQRPVLINGIEELAARGDLLDRSIITYLPQIPDEQRRPEEEFWVEFETARPQILGALYTSVSAAMRTVNTVKIKRLPRMADFAIWATAAESASGFEAGTFINAYTRNRESANDLALESSTVAPAIQEFIEEEIAWAGTATELLNAINDLADEEIRKKRERQRTWPKTPQALSNALRRLAPNLRVAGISVEFYRVGKKKTIRLEQARNSSSSSSPSSPPESASKEDIENEEFSSWAGYPDGDDEKQTYSNGPSREIIPCPTCNKEGKRLTVCLNCGDLIK